MRDFDPMMSEVRCKNCGRVNPPGSNFCMGCGEELPSEQTLPSCPNCGAAHPVDSAICPTCGAGLKMAEPEHDERGFELRLPRLHYAGFWIRARAYILDIIFLSLFAFLCGFLLALSIPPDAPEGLRAMSTLLGFVVSILYFTLFIGRYGWTPGKRICRLRVVRSDGSRVGYGRAMGRYFAYGLSALIFYIGFLMVIWTERKQGLHDKIVDTVVVRE